FVGLPRWMWMRESERSGFPPKLGQHGLSAASTGPALFGRGLCAVDLGGVSVTPLSSVSRPPEGRSATTMRYAATRPPATSTAAPTTLRMIHLGSRGPTT